MIKEHNFIKNAENVHFGNKAQWYSPKVDIKSYSP